MKRTVKRCRSWLAAALVLLVYIAARIAWGGLWTMAPVVELDGSADILTIALRHHADEGGNVILTLGNFGQVDFILNQLCRHDRRRCAWSLPTSVRCTAACRKSE